jgi:hypothetical protein
MTLISRREIQRIINENSSFLSKAQTSDFVRILNYDDSSSLAFEWEVLLLNAFSKIGLVKYENNNGKRKPDIYYQNKSDASANFLADITSVSDDDQRKNNPHDYFLNEFRKLLVTFKSIKGGFSFNVLGQNIGTFSDSKMKLLLPTKGDIPQFVKEYFTDYLRNINNNPNVTALLNVNNKSVKINVIYNPNDKYTVSSHPSYAVPYSLARNPLYNRLKSKAKQMKASIIGGVKGIIICDGGCDVLSDGSRGLKHYSQSQIIFHFLKRNKSISYVQVFTVKQSPYNMFDRNRLYFHSNLYINNDALFPIGETLKRILEVAVTLMPVPKRTPINALYHYNSANRHKGSSFYGGFSMSKQEIKLSSRSLAELLSGRIDYNKYIEDHKEASSYIFNKIMAGSMIENVRIEKCTADDDDWVVFTFGNTDPAISKFK